MKYSTASDFRQALEQRIKILSKGHASSISRNRKRVAYDRLLARLAVVAANQWVVKGGFALDLRLTDRARSTRDIDLAWRESDIELTEALIEASSQDAGDFFTFIIERSDEPRDRLGGAHRFRVSASLAGRLFDTFVLDVGTLDDTLTSIEVVSTIGLLDFAGIAPTNVPLLPLATHVAEKLHAYTRIYEGGRGSSRPKDLVDLVLIARTFILDAGALRLAIDRVFTQRGTHQPPTAVPAPPASWRLPYQRLAASIGMEEELTEAHTTAAAMLNPILQRDIAIGEWNPVTLLWAE